MNKKSITMAVMAYYKFHWRNSMLLRNICVQC